MVMVMINNVCRIRKETALNRKEKNLDKWCDKRHDRFMRDGDTECFSIDCLSLRPLN